MFGLFEINGPISAVQDGSETIATPNPYAWTQSASILYIDQPVGSGEDKLLVNNFTHQLITGFSHTNGKLVTTQEEMADDLYEMLRQWFLLFPDYLPNDFFIFGESYAGIFISVLSSMSYS